MSWYRLEAVRDALRLDFGAELAPGVVREDGPHLEIWQRTIEGHVHRSFLNYEGDELLLPEESVLAAAEGLKILPARRLLDRVRARGGLWLGPDPRPP